MTTIKKLEKMPYAQAYVRYEDEKNISLISYTTTVVEIKDNVLRVNGLYSRTTRKHISAFMQEYTVFDFAMAKTLYLDGVTLNLETGEIEKI